MYSDGVDAMLLYTVNLTDSDIHFNDSEKYFCEVAAWAKENCQSFHNYDVYDVSDTSTQCDYIAQYRFQNEYDLTAFKLRWK